MKKVKLRCEGQDKTQNAKTASLYVRFCVMVLPFPQSEPPAAAMGSFASADEPRIEIMKTEKTTTQTTSAAAVRVSDPSVSLPGHAHQQTLEITKVFSCFPALLWDCDMRR